MLCVSLRYRNESLPGLIDEWSWQDEGGCQGDQGCADEEHDELHVLAYHGHHPPQGEVSNTTVPPTHTLPTASLSSIFPVSYLDNYFFSIVGSTIRPGERTYLP